MRIAAISMRSRLGGSVRGAIALAACLCLTASCKTAIAEGTAQSESRGVASSDTVRSLGPVFMPPPGQNSETPAFGTIGPDPSTPPHKIMGNNTIGVNVLRNKTVIFFEYFNLDAACRPYKYSVSIENEPVNGHIVTYRSEFYSELFVKMAFSTKKNGQIDDRLKCNLSKLPATLFTYTPDSNYIGRESTRIRIMDHDDVVVEDFIFNVM